MEKFNSFTENVLSTNNNELTNNGPGPLFAISVFFSIFGAVVLLLLIKKIYFYFVKKLRVYIFPRVSIKGITNIALVISIAVVSIILIMSLTAGIGATVFRAFPGSRVTIEIILIKISGILFGPMIGMISGAFIDLLSFALTAGIFHYGYFICAMTVGLISGCIHVIIQISREKESVFAMLSAGFMFLFTLFVVLFFQYAANLPEYLSINIYGITSVNMRSSVLVYILFGFGMFIVFIILLLYLISWNNKRKFKFTQNTTHFASYLSANHPTKWKKNLYKNWYTFIVSVLLLATTSILLINLVLLPIFDSAIDRQPYSLWLSFRFIMSPFIFLIDVLVLFPIVSTISSIIKFNYEKETNESLDTPYFYEIWTSRTTKEKIYDRQQIKKCANLAKFDLDGEELDKLEYEFNQLFFSFEDIRKINVDNVEPMDYPIENVLFDENRLRKDVLKNDNSSSDSLIVLKNSIDKIVKNEHTYVKVK